MKLSRPVSRPLHHLHFKRSPQFMSTRLSTSMLHVAESFLFRTAQNNPLSVSLVTNFWTSPCRLVRDSLRVCVYSAARVHGTRTAWLENTQEGHGRLFQDSCQAWVDELR